MNDLAFFFKEGWQHIISFNALDHQLFIVALAAIYILKDWKKVLVLVTAFTVGHSLTLALSIYDVIRADEKWVEFLIPITIIITAIFNYFAKDFNKESLQLNYFFALFFGFIHGLGFANSIRFMLARNQKIGSGLLGFNLGLEAGQILCVAIILLSAYLVINIAGLKRTLWIYTLSTITILWAVKFAVERIP
jgi:hypothetical protein